MSGGADAVVKQWDVETGACERTLTGHSDAVSALIVVRERVLVSASWDKTIKVIKKNSSVCY